MNILDVIPGISSILDKVITTPAERDEAKLRMAEIDAREIEARLGVQREWLANKSVFVAGAIPMILWMISIVVLFNCIVSPLLAPIWRMPVVSLPDWYSGLATTIILGLFAKKTWDGNAIQVGSFTKPAKNGGEQAATVHPAPEVKHEQTGKAQSVATPQDKTAGADAAPAGKRTPEQVNARYEELVAQSNARSAANKP